MTVGKNCKNGSECLFLKSLESHERYFRKRFLLKYIDMLKTDFRYYDEHFNSELCLLLLSVLMTAVLKLLSLGRR